MVYPIITNGGRSTTATTYGGQELTKLQQYLSGINIATTDTTNKPIIMTETTFASGILKLADANSSNIIKVLTPDIAIDVSVRFPQSMTNVVNDNEFLLTNIVQVMKGKVMDATQNTIINLDDANFKSNASVGWGKVSKSGSKLNDLGDTPNTAPTTGQSLIYDSTSAAWTYYSAITSSDINLPNKTSSLPVADSTKTPIYRNDLDVNTQRVYISKLEGGSAVLVRLA